MTDEAQTSSLDAEIAALVVGLLEKVRRLKLRRALDNQAAMARRLRTGGAEIYDERGRLRGEMKICVDPFLANQMRIKRHAENEYMREHNLSPFADPEYIPFLKKHNPLFACKFAAKEGTVFMPDTSKK